MVQALRAENFRLGFKKETGFASPDPNVSGVGTFTFWPEIVQTIDGFVDEIDWKVIRARGGTREPYQIVEGKHMTEGSFNGVIQSGKWIAMTMGEDFTSGSTPTNATTLSLAASPGDTTITVVSAAGYATGDIVNIERTVSTKTETREVASVAGSVITLKSPPLARAHASGVAVEEVVSPFTHTIKPFNPTGTQIWPSWTFELDYNPDGTTNADLPLFLRGITPNAIRVSGAEEDIAKFSVAAMGHSVVKNTVATPRLSSVTTDTREGFKFHQAAFTYFGSLVARVKDFEWSYTNGGKLAWYYDTSTGVKQFPKEYIPGAVTYGLRTTVVPVDATFFDQLKLALNNLTCDILFTRGASDTFLIRSTNVAIKSGSHNLPEELEVSVPLDLEVRNAEVQIVNTDGPGYV